ISLRRISNFDSPTPIPKHARDVVQGVGQELSPPSSAASSRPGPSGRLWQLQPSGRLEKWRGHLRNGLLPICPLDRLLRRRRLRRLVVERSRGGSQSSSPPLAQMLSPTRRLSKHPQPHQFRRQTQQWIATNPKIAGYKAEEALSRLWEEQKELFRRWEEQQQQQQQTQTPSADSSESAPAILLTTESVNLVLQAWCRSNNGEIGAERAERLLHWMEDLSAAESVEPAWSPFLPQPDYQSYATVIDAWSRAAAYESANPSRSAADATESKSGGRVSQSTKAGFECAKRAEELLMHMQRMHERRLQTTEGGEGSDNYNSDVQPDTRVFDLVLAGWSGVHGGTKASAIRAMRILDLMQELHHAQSREAPEWHDVALSKVQPNLSTYKAVLTAWARAARTLEGPDRAEEILRHMLSLSKAGNLGAEILPDVECFHMVMNAHADAIRERRKGDDGSSSAERARKVTALLDWMELLSLRGRTAKIRPTTETYRIALSAWVWSHHVDAPREAEGILYRMINAGDEGEGGANSLAVGVVGGAKRPHESSSVRPETRDFNTLINCCSFARRVGADKSSQDDESMLRMQLEHEEVFDVAEGALQTLLSLPYVQPDSATFAGIIGRASTWFRIQMTETTASSSSSGWPIAPPQGTVPAPRRRPRRRSGCGPRRGPDASTPTCCDSFDTRFPRRKITFAFARSLRSIGGKISKSNDLAY
ncbi:hypothetical protein ACHAWF_003070, partial [Thalassiosira exigua]